MTAGDDHEKIKVWLVVDPFGFPSLGFVPQHEEKNAWEEFIRLTQLSATALREKGWTVQPYTLVKGHENE